MTKLLLLLYFPKCTQSWCPLKKKKKKSVFPENSTIFKNQEVEVITENPWRNSEKRQKSPTEEKQWRAPRRICEFNWFLSLQCLLGDLLSFNNFHMVQQGSLSQGMQKWDYAEIPINV